MGKKERKWILPIGAIIQTNMAKYEIIDNLGHGGNSEVFKIKEREGGFHNREWALKVFWPQREDRREDEKAITRFLNEGKVLSKVKHKNIIELKDDSGYLPVKENKFFIENNICKSCDIELYDSDKRNGSMPYLILELCDFSFDKENLDKENLIFKEKVDIFIQACEGVCALHDFVDDKGDRLFHRDIKPTNLLIKKMEDKTNIVKVADFGIAHITPNFFPDYVALTESEEWLANQLCASPEQKNKKTSNIDYRTDIYSLGMVGYILFVGDYHYSLKKLNKINNKVLKSVIYIMTSEDKEKRYNSLNTVIKLLKNEFCHIAFDKRLENSGYKKAKLVFIVGALVSIFIAVNIYWVGLLLGLFFVSLHEITSKSAESKFLTYIKTGDFDDKFFWNRRKKYNKKT